MITTKNAKNAKNRELRALSTHFCYHFGVKPLKVFKKIKIYKSFRGHFYTKLAADYFGGKMLFRDKLKNSRRQFKDIFNEFKKANPCFSEDDIIDYTPEMVEVIKVYLKDGRQVIWNGQSKEIIDIR